MSERNILRVADENLWLVCLMLLFIAVGTCDTDKNAHCEKCCPNLKELKE